MPVRKVHALSLAAVLAAGTVAPCAAHDNLPPAVTAGYLEPPPASDFTADAPAPAPKASAPAAEPAPTVAQAPAPKPKENGFVRALAAPFRALVRLFSGGGRKTSAESAKKRKEEPAAAEQAEAQPARPAAENTVAPQQPAETAEAPAAGPRLPAPPAQEGVRIIRPDEEPQAATLPRTWLPFVEGVGRDPLSQGRALLERGYLNEAIAELSIAAAGGGNLVEANNLLGLAYDRLGWHQQATEAYERGLTASPRDPVLLTNLGYSLYLSNDFGGALKRLREAARLAPAQPLVHNHLGLVQARLGKYGDAFKSFARATNEYDAHLRLAGLLEAVRRDRQAARHYEAALRLQPDSTAVLERLLALYERTGQSTKADTARRTLGKPRNEQRTVTGGGGG